MQVEEARQLLMEYNGRLAAELEERKRVAIMLHNFIGAQKEALARAEQKLQVNLCLFSVCASLPRRL